MKLNYIKGVKAEKDRIILLTSTDNEGKPIEKEWFRIFKVALLINQIGINELIIKDKWEKINPEKDFPFWFRNAIIDALDMTDKRLDWALEENVKEVKKWCLRNRLKFTPIEPELRRVWQTRLEDYKGD